jgi:hypothetical protein
MDQPSVHYLEGVPTFRNQDFALLEGAQHIKVVHFNIVTAAIREHQIAVCVPRHCFETKSAIIIGCFVLEAQHGVFAQVNFKYFIGNNRTAQTRLAAEILNEGKVVAHGCGLTFRVSDRSQAPVMLSLSLSGGKNASACQVGQIVVSDIA